MRTFKNTLDFLRNDKAIPIYLTILPYKQLKELTAKQ